MTRDSIFLILFRGVIKGSAFCLIEGLKANLRKEYFIQILLLINVPGTLVQFIVIIGFKSYGFIQL